MRSIVGLIIACTLSGLAIHGQSNPTFKITPIPLPASENPRVLAVEADLDRKLLAILIGTAAQDQLVILNEALKPVKEFQVRKNVKHLALDQSTLYFSALHGSPRQGATVCRVILSTLTTQCMDLVNLPEALFIANGVLHETSGGNVFSLDLDTGARKLVYHFTHELDSLWTVSSAGSSVVLANGLTGKGLKCIVPGWHCDSLEFLSPEQKESLSSKHPNELFFDKLVHAGSAIYILGGRYHPARGFELYKYGPDGGFANQSQLLAPKGIELANHFIQLVLRPCEKFRIKHFHL